MKSTTMEKTYQSRRQVLQLSGVALAGGLAGCFGSESDEDSSNEATGSDETDTVEEENDDTFELESIVGDLSDNPIPDDPEDYDYATVGTGDAPVTATFYAGWKCPFTQRFISDTFADVVEEFVAPGDVDIVFRAVAYRDGEPFHGDDGPRSTQAGLSVWHTDPESYWSFFEYLFTNMDPGYGWATTDRLLAIADEANVAHRDQIQNAIENDIFDAQVQQTMQHVQEIPISTVPRILVDGETSSPSATPSATWRQLKNAVEREQE